MSVSRRSVLAGVAGAVGVAAVPATSRARLTTSPALFVAAHPDDEVLGMSVALAEHVAAGQDVHVLWLTPGESSGVRSKINGTGTVSAWWGVTHVPADEGYAPLSVAEFGRARLAEGEVAVRCLTTGLPGSVTTHTAELVDGSVTVADAAQAIRDVANLIAPGAAVRVKTHSHLVDDHPDHLHAGLAARQLAAAEPARFGDLRHYVLPPYWTDPRLTQVSEAWDTPSDTGITARVKNACRSYAAWHPPHSFAIGYHSVPTYFSTLEANTRCMFHT